MAPAAAAMDFEGVPLGVRRGAWTEEEDALLRKCIEKHGEGKWHQVPFRAGLNRCRKSCRLRWMNYLRPNIKRGSFTVDEVDLIIRLHKLLGNRWSLIAGRLPGRTANGVKNYWNTHLQKKLESEAKSNKPMAMGITKVIRPQPRTFSKSSLPWLRTKTVILNPGDHHHIQTRDNLIKITKPCTLTTDHHIQTMDNFITEPSPQSSAGAGDHDGSTFWWNDIILDDDMEIDKEIAWSVGGSSAAEEGNNIVAGQNWDGKLTPGMEKPGHISVEVEGRQSDYWSDFFVNNADLWDILIDDQAVILQ